MKWQAPAAGFLLFIALCASVAYWGMQMFKPPARQVAATQAAKPEIRLDAAAALLGGQLGGTAVASNFQLTGVVVSGTPDQSVAIITTDGKPPKAVGVNSEVTSGVVVREVHPQYVMLSDGGVMKRIELPITPTNSQQILLPVRPMPPAVVEPPPPPSPPINNPPDATQMKNPALVHEPGRGRMRH